MVGSGPNRRPCSVLTPRFREKLRILMIALLLDELRYVPLSSLGCGRLMELRRVLRPLLSR